MKSALRTHALFSQAIRRTLKHPYLWYALGLLCLCLHLQVLTVLSIRWATKVYNGCLFRCLRNTHTAAQHSTALLLCLHPYDSYVLICTAEDADPICAVLNPILCSLVSFPWMQCVKRPAHKE